MITHFSGPPFLLLVIYGELISHVNGICGNDPSIALWLHSVLMYFSMCMGKAMADEWFLAVGVGILL